MADAPATLPADFFTKQQSATPVAPSSDVPTTLPADFFAKQSTSNSSPPPATLPADFFTKEQPAEPKGIVGRAWDWANTPLWNINSTNRGGFVGGTEDVLSGLTSPLSIGLTLGTLGGGAILRGLDLGAEEVPVAIRGIQKLVSAGFTGQQVYQAVHESPRVLDALKEGDYDTAERLGVHVITGGALGALGAKETLRDAGALAENVGLHAKPSEENAKLGKEAGVMDEERAIASNNAQNLTEGWRKQYKGIKDDQLGSIFFHTQAGGDKSILAKWYNLVAKSAGRDDRVAAGPENTADIPTKAKVEAAGGEFRGTKDGLVEVTLPRTLTESLPIDDKFKDFVSVTVPEKDLTTQSVRDAIQKKYMEMGGKEQIGPSPEESHLENLANKKLVAEKYTPKQIDAVLSSIKGAMNMSPKQLELAGKVRDQLSQGFEQAHQSGMMKNAIENYITQLWEKPEDNPAAKELLHNASMGRFDTSVTMARQRTFQNAVEGILLGRKLRTTDPIAITGHYMNQVGQAVANRNFLGRLKDKFLRTSEGMPMVATSGTGTVVTDEAGNPSVTLVNPTNISNIRISDNVLNTLKASGDLDRFLQADKIVKTKAANGEPLYYWNTHDYKTIDSPAFRNWKWIATDSGGKPIQVKGELRVHPDVADYLTKRLGLETSPLRTSRPLQYALKGGQEAKDIMLSFSPFHIAQEGLRAIMTGINPFGIEKFDLEHDPTLRLGVRNNLTLGREAHGLQDFQEGVASNSKLINKIPVLKQLQGGLQHFLFDQYIPGLKARAFKSLYERYQSAHPDWTADQAAHEAATDTNERFGGLNYKAIGRSVTTQDFMRLTTLAPDWLESEIRFAARLLNPKTGGIARMDALRLTAGLIAASRVMNYLVSGKPHWEAPFGVAVKDDNGQEKIYSVRTLPTDLLHAASDPMGFLRGRISPLAHTGVELATGRDERGRRIPTNNLFVDLGRNVAPIPAQNIIKQATGENTNITNPDQLVKAIGGTVAPYRTEAEKLAGEIASDRSESGPFDPAQRARQSVKRQFEDDLRAGKMSPQTVFQLVEGGHMAPKEAKQIIEQSKMTSLQARINGMGMPDVLKVWDAATPQEQEELAPLLMKKRMSYMRNSLRNKTPAEREQDPTYQRLKRMFPEQLPL